MYHQWQGNAGSSYLAFAVFCEAGNLGEMQAGVLYNTLYRAKKGERQFLIYYII